jgi:molybdate/tungstate transport system substrate-binding protein
MRFSMKISSAILVSIFILTALVSAWAADSTVSVLYAGSLVNLMERSAGPAFEQKSGDRFQGYAGGSNQVANEIKGKLRRGDLKNKSWYEVLAEPGIKVGRTDPKLDPKGALTIELLKRAEVFYNKPGLSEQIIGAPDNQSQILPEETLVGRLQSGQLDVGFFYSTETSAAKIPAIKLPDEIAPKARYTLTILRDAPSPDGAERFVSFLLGPQGRELLKQYGLELLKPELSGNVQAVPPAVRSLVDAAQ